MARTGETFGSTCTHNSPGRPPVLELPAWFEIGSLVVLTLILIGDLLLVVKRPHIPSFRESTLWVVFYVVLAYLNTQFPEVTRSAWPAPATDPGMLRAIFLIFVELLLVTAIALFFSTFSSPFLSAALTFGLWVIGHFNTDLRNFEAVVESRPAAYLARGLYYLLPNFAAFDIKTQVVHALPVPAAYVITTALYGLLYIALLLTGAVVIFSRRDFK